MNNLVRFLYYTICQEIYNCNLSLHYVKSFFLFDLNGELNSKNEKYLAKNIIDVFDKKYSDNYNRNFNEWIGTDNSEIKIPLLLNYVDKYKNINQTLIDNLIELRNKDIFIHYREAINKMQIAIINNEKNIVNKILADIETYTNKILKGEYDNPSRYIHKIGLSIPFIGGLGTEINISLPKFRKNPGDKILIFLHRLINNI